MNLASIVGRSLATVALGVSLAAPALAAPVVFNNALTPGITQFDTIISGAGGTVQTQQVIYGQTSYTDFTVTRPLGGTPTMDTGYSAGAGQSLTGAVFGISPFVSGGDPIPGFQSGIRFNFLNPINAIGFEIGDWATCCHTGTRPGGIQSSYGVPALGSGLWIAFDGGSSNLTANALSALDNPGYAQFSQFTNFIGAVDTSATFSSVTFFGDGFGEYLVAGGTIRFATLDIGTEVPNPSAVPVPAALPLLAAGLGLLGVGARRRRNGSDKA